MFDPRGFTVKDLAKARRFYDACAQALATIDKMGKSCLIARQPAAPPTGRAAIGSAPPSISRAYAGRAPASCAMALA